MGITIYAKKNYISFFNSPYYSHKNRLAVDIYPTGNSFDALGLSPVEGTISKIYEIKTPRPKYFETLETEHLVLITPKENANVYVRLLHINSDITTGTNVSVGDRLGFLVRSGFFNFWTWKHLHIEIRRLIEPRRAKGGYPLRPINNSPHLSRNPEMPHLMKTRKVTEDYALIEVEQGLTRIGNFWGLECRVKNICGILDCGLPYYC